MYILCAVMQSFVSRQHQYCRLKEVLECDECIVGHLVWVGLIVNVERFFFQRGAPPFQLGLESGPFGALLGGGSDLTGWFRLLLLDMFGKFTWAVGGRGVRIALELAKHTARTCCISVLIH